MIKKETTDGRLFLFYKNSRVIGQKVCVTNPNKLENL